MRGRSWSFRSIKSVRSLAFGKGLRGQGRHDFGAVMILVVDDQPEVLEEVRAALENDGHDVVTALNGLEALELARQRVPKLILSDVYMPELGGLEFQKEYKQNFPSRDTPFVFLSSVQDVDTMVQGLEQGADDYLAKPINPTFLCAKVRAVLRRWRRTISRAVRGNLADVPFATVVRSCELKGLTGVLEVQAPDELISIRFRAGVLDEGDAERALDRVMDLQSGWFTIRSEEPDFRDLDDGSASNMRSVDEQPELLLGRLSSISLSKRVFQIETETLSEDPACVVTIVTVEGKTVWKRTSRVPQPVDSKVLAARVDEQHEQVQQYVQHKLDAAMQDYMERPNVTDGPVSSAGGDADSGLQMEQSHEISPYSVRTDSSSRSDTYSFRAPAPSLGPVSSGPVSSGPVSSGPMSTRTARFHQLFDDGYDHYRKGDYAEAVRRWQDALVLDPSSAVLAVNLKVAQTKLAAQSKIRSFNDSFRVVALSRQLSSEIEQEPHAKARRDKDPNG